MMIRIQYADGRYDMVKIYQLDRFIAESRISGFRRATGWVVIGRDPIRRNSKDFFLGTEKRYPTGPLPAPGQKSRGDFESLSSQENRLNRYLESNDG